MKRSQITQVPALSAGRIVTARWSARASAKASASRLGPVRGEAPGQQELPQRLGARAAARLAGDEDGDPLPLQPLRQPRRVAGFARPLAAFERDEAAAPPQGSQPNSSSPSASSAREWSEPRPTERGGEERRLLDQAVAAPDLAAMPTSTPASTGAMSGP